MKRVLVVTVVWLAWGTTQAHPVLGSPGDFKVSDQTYVRHDGGADATIAACSTNNRQQNEPAASVAPHNPRFLTSGANDYCPVPTAGGTWAWFYFSADGGATWVNSLLPGYPTDTSAEGMASPLFGETTNAGDPVQAWDDDGHLYFGGIAFNRQQPAVGSIWVARYSWPSGAAPDYEHTAIVSRGTPSPLFQGIFEDKVMLEVDRGAESPHAGNVYVCWTRFTASGANNAVWLARSTDGGKTFKDTKLSESVHGSQFCDIAVTRKGDVYAAWRQFEFDAERGQTQDDAVAWVKSTDGGRKFTKPQVATDFLAWDVADRYASPAAAGKARYDACLAVDGTPGGCAGPEPQTHARDCGDGPFACQSGYVFFRANSQVRITADPTENGDPDEVFVVYDASVAGSETPTGTSFGTAGAGVGTQAAVYLIETADAGKTWSAPQRIDPQADGHQFFPDVHADSGVLHAVWQDSRSDCAAGPGGGDFRTVPISNSWAASNPPGSVACGPGLETFYAKSSDGGAGWTVSKVSSVAQMPQYEQFGNRDVPFFGDYNYIAAAGSTAFMAWTDTRDTEPGTDPRRGDDGTDGFDVLQCRAALPDGSVGPDTCPDAGGLDQNIYGAVAAP